MTHASNAIIFVRDFQRAFGLEVDGIAGPATRAKLADIAPPAKPDPSGRAAAPGHVVHDIPDDYFPMLAQIESRGRPYVKARTSSASGLYQFVRSTWIGEGGEWGTNPAKAFGGLLPSEGEQLQRARSFTQRNAVALMAKGVPVNRASLYAAHFLGVNTACRMILADVGAAADRIAGTAATSANPSVLRGKSVGQFMAWLHDKTGDWAR